jgi:hypothetical protein
MDTTMNTNSENATNGPPWIPIPGYETGYPHPSRKIGQAWAAVWSELQGATDWVDGVDLANRTATEVGLKPVTMIGVMSRAAAAGLLERSLVKVDTQRGPRQRTHYKIPCPECAEYKGTGGEDVTCATCGKPGSVA